MSMTLFPSGCGDIAGVLWGWQWDSDQANGHTVLTYSFPTAASDYLDYPGIHRIQAFNAQQQGGRPKSYQHFMTPSATSTSSSLPNGSATAISGLVEANSVDVGDGPEGNQFRLLGIFPDPNTCTSVCAGRHLVQSLRLQQSRPRQFRLRLRTDA